MATPNLGTIQRREVWDVISQTAEYALRAMTFLADHAGESHTTDAISSVTKVPAGYLAKILQALARAGLINSQRGPYGGFSLARSGDSISLLDVVGVVDPISRIDSCPLRLRSHASGLCPLHRLLDDLSRDIQERLRTVTISSLLAERGEAAGLRPLCDFPRHAVPDATRAKRRTGDGANS